VFLLEHHGKELLAAHGIAVPPGVFITPGDDLSRCQPPREPWMVKAQVAAGGRGKAGAVRPAVSLAEVARIIAELDGVKVKGKPIQGFRIEQRVDFRHEAYLSFSVDAAAAAIRLMVATEGGVEVETLAQAGGLRSALAAPEQLTDAISEICADLPTAFRAAVGDATAQLGDIFLRYEATLLEVNPLFILPDGTWSVGDLKLVIDDDAIVPRD
jgi:succinyl-CoA synthetase beta subunit